jgi:hypothetical protein
MRKRPSKRRIIAKYRLGRRVTEYEIYQHDLAARIDAINGGLVAALAPIGMRRDDLGQWYMPASLDAAESNQIIGWL